MSELDLRTVVRDYGDPEGEARACRDACALFDFSFMSRAQVSGAGALTALARLQSRPMHDLPAGRIRYALRLGRGAVVLADLTIWNLGAGRYEVMSGRHVDILDLGAFCPPGTVWVDLSQNTAVFAVQGPTALRAFAGLTDTARLACLPYFGHDSFVVAGMECRIGRLGYTGERGFELILPRRHGPRLWQVLTERARPAGFAAADSLRIEAGFILFANECRFGATAREMGLQRFAGSEAPGERPRVRLTSFMAVTARHPVLWQPAPGAQLPPHPSEIAVSSACYSAREGCTVGLGYVGAGGGVGDATEVRDPSGYFRRIRLVSGPLYDPQKRRPKGPWSEDDI